MVELFKFTAKQFLFWLIYFILIQSIFLAFFSNELPEISFSHIISTFFYGLGLNLAASAYLTIISYVLFFISSFSKKGIFQKINFYYLSIAVFVCLMINTVDFALYQNWGTKINGKALWYLKFSDSTNTAKGYIGLWKYAISMFVISGIAIFYYFKYLIYFQKANSKKIIKISGFLFVLFLLFYALRGGITGRPIDRGSSFYSKHAVLNYAAINGFWNFFDMVSHFKTPPKPYNFFTDEEIEIFKTKFYKIHQSKAPKLSNITKPNIIFIYLESWSADVTGCVGGEKDITPCFDKLSHEGILFKNFYSTGFRTEQGLMASLSGFPAQAQTYPMLDFDRFDNYPNLIKEMSKIGYYTSYFTGGNPHFANTDVYLISAGIDKINKDLLGKAKRKSAWGALDEESFDNLINGIDKQKQPFFTSMVTITSHEWFEADVPKIFEDKDEVSARYKNTIHYSDSCLYDFLKKASKKQWYKNTLIFIMADHSCSYPLHHEMNSPQRYHIPFLITGGALKSEFINTINNVYACHLNIPAIVCDEININKKPFIFSENVLADSINSFAYFAFDHGFGMLKRNNEIVYDFNLNKIIHQFGNRSTVNNLFENGKFLMQYSSLLKEEFQSKK